MSDKSFLDSIGAPGPAVYLNKCFPANPRIKLCRWAKALEIINHTTRCVPATKDISCLYLDLGYSPWPVLHFPLSHKLMSITFFDLLSILHAVFIYHIFTIITKK